MRQRNTRWPAWRRSAGLVLLGLASAALIAGCGGSGGGGSTGGRAVAEFTVRWPSGGSRVIPSQTNRIVVHVNGPGITGDINYVVDKPAFGTTTTFSINVPVGAKRVFSAEARDTSVGPNSKANFSQPTQVPGTSPELKVGSMVAAGIDPKAYDITPGSHTSAIVDLQTAGLPAEGTDAVTLTINQIVTDTFPTTLVLALFRDQQGNPITNINAMNLQVIEDGTTAVITDVRTVLQAASALSIALVLDRSGSMSGTPNSDLETAATAFVNLMQATDAGAVVNFDENVVVTQAFTTDKALLNAAIQNQYSNFGGSTALFDAIYTGAQTAGQRSGRRAVLAMTDGYENSSTHTESEVIAAAKANGTPVFTVGLGSADATTLTDIATQTGGFYTEAPTSSDLTKIYQKISSQLNGQMQISFISPRPTKLNVVRHVIIRYTYGTFTGEASMDYTM